MRIVFVPSTLALLPGYASIDDPIPDLRKAVHTAVEWLLDGGPATAFGDPRIAAHLLGDRRDGTGRLVVANGSATRTEKAPGFLDERAAGYDAAIGAALAAGDPAVLAGLDPDLGRDLWAFDVDKIRAAVSGIQQVTDVQVDYDDAPFGVQYWVVRWECRA